MSRFLCFSFGVQIEKIEKMFATLLIRMNVSHIGPISFLLLPPMSVSRNVYVRF